MLNLPKTVLFFQQIELVFQENVNYSTKNALYCFMTAKIDEKNDNFFLIFPISDFEIFSF